MFELHSLGVSSNFVIRNHVTGNESNIFTS